MSEIEIISGIRQSVGILSTQTLIEQHPWVSDPQAEYAKLKQEQKEEQQSDPYRAVFEQSQKKAEEKKEKLLDFCSPI